MCDCANRMELPSDDDLRAVLPTGTYTVKCLKCGETCTKTLTEEPDEDEDEG